MKQQDQPHQHAHAVMLSPSQNDQDKEGSLPMANKTCIVGPAYCLLPGSLPVHQPGRSPGSVASPVLWDQSECWVSAPVSLPLAGVALTAAPSWPGSGDARPSLWWESGEDRAGGHTGCLQATPAAGGWRHAAAMGRPCSQTKSEREFNVYEQ